MANNYLGINAFSGPMGEKEPAYGAEARMKVLDAIAPPGTPSAVNAPQRAKRAAVRGKTIQAQPQPQPMSTAPTSPQGQVASYDQSLAAFWQQAAATPGASPQVIQYAAEVG